MVKGYSCLKCDHFTQDILIEKGYQCYLWHGDWYHETIVYECHRQLKVIRKLRKRCKFFSPYTQTRLRIEVNGMVKLAEVPNEGARYDMNKLPEKVELVALEEKTVAESEGKAGGLKITFKDRNDVKVTQKYTAISGAILTTALKGFGIKDTEELQAVWMLYELTKMRMGYPRYIPVEKCKKQ